MSHMDLTDRDLLPGENKSGKTEWEDALIKHGIVQAEKVQKNEDDLYQEAIERKQAEDPHANKSLDELDELEDELEDTVLAQYRARRLDELKARAKREVYGEVYTVREPEFVREVSQAPEGTYVVLHLYSASEPECIQLDKHMQTLAAKHRAVKFCKIRAQEAIHNFPSSKCPTLLIYYNSHIIKQVEKLGLFGGSARISPQSLEWALAQPFTVRPPGADEDQTHRILKTDLKEDPLAAGGRLNRLNGGSSAAAASRKQKGYSSDEVSDDDD